MFVELTEAAGKSRNPIGVWLKKISMNERSFSHIGEQGQMHMFNISKGTWPGLLKIEKRRLWLAAPRDFAARLPC